ncbi:MAG: helix-turn-helix domain-containing protein [Alphaproteobacteria bacterium]|nr:helix-turn-helix domain-containing protein [Alphaproteobacteria bacterium]MBU0792706.1 helix-turn-helix domain-containing protein [Alphaproteobacteria bacterium]MBU0877289.1 helix-turn-helix domain-containing protein [Alphaproteobacteria bacterium]MBU1770536.1 helix-turn-helix domain-containing protein [Alphaproteobacteria bacterium]
MEAVNLEGLSSVVDLSGVDRAKRADIWAGAAPNVFPGLSVQAIEANPSLGAIFHRRMGPGALFAISSAPAEVSYAPSGSPESHQFLTMMLQAEGSSIASQRQRQCELAPGDVCFIDERYPFRLCGLDYSQLLLLRMPRALVMSRFPDMEHLVATLIPGRDPGTSLLAHTVLHLLRVAGELREAQQHAAMNAVIHLLGATSGLAVELENVHWRVQKALDFIELNLSIPGLTAEQVAQAQHISRRRLDQLMRDALGLSITGQIWNRRLQRAADDLRDARWAGASISQIAFANGFEDPAHFARAFKRRFETTPGQWRALARPMTH